MGAENTERFWVAEVGQSRSKQAVHSDFYQTNIFSSTNQLIAINSTMDFFNWFTNCRLWNCCGEIFKTCLALWKHESLFDRHWNIVQSKTNRELEKWSGRERKNRGKDRENAIWSCEKSNQSGSRLIQYPQHGVIPFPKNTLERDTEQRTTGRFRHVFAIYKRDRCYNFTAYLRNIWTGRKFLTQ